MKTPFTSDQFFEVLRSYNETVFPWQSLLYLIGALAIYWTIIPGKKSDKAIVLILSFFWLWMGAMYHLLFFTTINKAAYLFAALFIIEGILFLYIGLVQKKLSFEFQADRFGIAGIVLLVYALIVYPLLGYWLGHVYPDSPTFGLPCPTTIFTFGILLMTSGKCPVSLLIIPAIWSVIGFMAAFNFGVMEDTGLIIAALYAVPMLLLRNRVSSGQASSPERMRGSTMVNGWLCLFGIAMHRPLRETMLD